MEFLVEFEISHPDGAPETEVSTREHAEALAIPRAAAKTTPPPPPVPGSRR